MSITYASQTGTTINSHALNETLGDQSQQSGNNTVVFSDVLSVAGNGNIGTGVNGIGDSFVGRRIIIDEGLSTEQVRECIADAAGTGTTRILTVNRDWDTNPVITTDTGSVPYEFGDVEDGGSGGGVGFGARTGAIELSNTLTVATTGGIEVLAGQYLESVDDGANISNIIQSGGRFYGGYDAGNKAYVNGALSTQYNGVAGEPSWQMQSGSRVDFYDTLFLAQLQTQQFENAAGSDSRYSRCKWTNLTQELHLFDSTIRDSSVVGKGGTVEIVRVNSGTDVIGFVVSKVDTLETASGNTTTETVGLRDTIFASVTDLITLVDNKTWNMDNPIWSATLHSDFNSTAVTGAAAIYDRTTVDAVVKEADGTLLQNALVNIYEHTIQAALELELTSDVNGVVAGAFNYLAHVWTTGTGATTTYGGHARQAGKWLYLPAVFAQSSTDEFSGDITLSPDANIVQQTQATAITDGAGVTWNEDTNPSELFDFTLGSGTQLDGMIITFTSGAVGTITAAMSGDSVAGEIHLKDRNATAITNGDTFSRTGGTAGTFSGTYTNDTKQPFSVWIEGNAKSYQTLYDFVAATQQQTTRTTLSRQMWSWCQSTQTQPLYATGSSFYTEMSNSKGIIIVNGGAGTLDYFTDDANVQWTPPTSITLKMVVKDVNGIVTGAFAYIDDDNALPYIMNTTTDGSGEASVAHTDGPIAGTTWRVRKYGYRPFTQTVDIAAVDITLPVTLIIDPQQT